MKELGSTTNLSWKARLVVLLEIVVIAGPVLTLLWWGLLKVSGIMGENLGIREMSLVAIPHSLIVLGAIALVARWREESMADFLWNGFTKQDIWIGLGLVAVCFGIDYGGRFVARALFPAHYAGTHNAMLDSMRSPLDYGLFVAIGLIGGGFREEMLRSYVIHRFGEFFGSRVLGLIIFGVWFAIGHFDLQDLSTVFSTAVASILFGAIYIWRGNMIAPMVSHGLFNALETTRYYLWGPPAF